MSYSQSLRNRVIAHVEAGYSRREAATLFNINHQTVNNWLKQPQLKKTRRAKSNLKVSPEQLQQHIQNHPDAYLAERATYFNMSINGIWSAMKRLNITKKNVDVPSK